MHYTCVPYAIARHRPGKGLLHDILASTEWEKNRHRITIGSQGWDEILKVDRLLCPSLQHVSCPRHVLGSGQTATTARKSPVPVRADG